MAKFTHQYDFNIQLPQAVISPIKHLEVNKDALEGKVIIGLCGYSKSGKDTIAQYFIDDFKFDRIAFADNIKREMNIHLKELVYSDLCSKQQNYFDISEVDFFTEKLEVKTVLRPYIIWYGEKLREINGVYYWINKAFQEDAKDKQNIIITDVRREAELELFRNSNEFNKRYIHNLVEAGMDIPDNVSTKNYGTLFFHVSQYGLKDKDILTQETIRMAQEEWLFDYNFLVDSRIEGAKFRKKAITKQIKKVVCDFGILKPEKTEFIQTNIFQESKLSN